jgi:putative nucleotidyltransferase with HDIG domain
MERIISILIMLSFLEESYAVGGCIRDLLLGREAKDIDVATRHTPERVMELARAQGLSVIPTGIEHGTVTVLLDGEPIEITTYRRDVSTDGRRATTAWASSIEEDLARRDFTINALAMDAQGVIIDPYGGQQDLELGLLKTVGAPRDRFTEDYLRIVRLYRFMGRYGMKLDPATSRAACELGPAVLDHVSVERVVQEIDKAFSQCEAPSGFLDHLERRGILGGLVPELSQLRHRRQNPLWHPEGDAWVHTLEVVDRAPRVLAEWQAPRWAALLHDVGKAVAYQPVDGAEWCSFHGHADAGAEIVARVGRDLKLPTKLTQSLKRVTRLHMRPLDADRVPQITDRMVRRFQAEAGDDIMLLQHLCTADAGSRRGPGLARLFAPQDVPTHPVLLGRHLIAEGFKPGPQFKTMLDRAYAHQLDEGCTDLVELLRVAIR